MQKTRTGIKGLDSILNGGYLTGSPTLINGGPGSGKTIMTLLFVQSLLSQSESVLYITFDEKPQKLLAHMHDMGVNQKKLDKDKLFFIDASINFDEKISGQFDMLTLISRASYMIKKNNIKNIVVDSIQNVHFADGDYTPREELLQLFEFARLNNITLIATMGEGVIDKDALIAKFSVDCVIELEQVINKLIMTRYLRVLKCRGSKHGTNVYPFCIFKSGISLLPITNSSLNYESTVRFVSSGIKMLDKILGGKGIPLQSNIIISGKAGTAKTSLAAKIAESACNSGLKVCFCSFEESPSDLIMNMKSPNIKLSPLIKNKKLFIHSARSVEIGLEEHILSIIAFIEEHHIQMVIIDPITALLDVGESLVVKSIVLRFLNYTKTHGITVVFTELLTDYDEDSRFLSISSLSDVWIRLRLIENDGEFYRALYVVKARGLAQSHQVKEMQISNKGITLLEPYISDGKIVFGAKRAMLEMNDKLTEEEFQEEKRIMDEEIKVLENKKNRIERKRKLYLIRKNTYRRSRE